MHTYWPKLKYYFYSFQMRVVVCPEVSLSSPLVFWPTLYSLSSQPPGEDYEEDRAVLRPPVEDYEEDETVLLIVVIGHPYWWHYKDCIYKWGKLMLLFPAFHLYFFYNFVMNHLRKCDQNMPTNYVNCFFNALIKM